MKLDNTALTAHQTCPAKFDLRINNHWAPRGRSAALGAGGVMHLGLAEWHRTYDLGKALLAIGNGWPEGHPPDDWRTKEKCITTMIEYTKMYPSEAFTIVGAPENPLIEVAFTIELDGLRVPFCGNWVDYGGAVHQGCGYMILDRFATVCPRCSGDLEPIEYGGIFDGLIEFSSQVYVFEHKTTSMPGTPPHNYYFEQFKPNNQVSGYIWGAEHMSGRKVVGAMVNMIGWLSKGSTKFGRQATSRGHEALAEWKKNVQLTCAEIKFHEYHGFWPLRTSACMLYGKCEFHSVHVLENESERMSRLETDYIKDKWDYEARKD